MKILDVPQSGSVGGVTSSRNSYGQYRRNRATPVNPNTSAQGVVRARMSANAAAWRALTDAQRAGWASLGSGMVRTDALGQSYTLKGFQAYCSVNNVLDLMGSSPVSDAPLDTTPLTPTGAVITLTSASFSIAYTPTPMPASTKLAVYASPQRSAGRGYEADYRFIQITAAAAASPVNVLAAYTAKFGVPVTGRRVFISLVACNGGFQSGPLLASAVIA